MITTGPLRAGGWQAVVACDCPRCPATYPETVSGAMDGPATRLRAEGEGWFVERFPKRAPRDFCPAHADAYRTMLFRALEGRAS